MDTSPGPGIFTVGHGAVVVDLSLALYGVDTIFRATYKFTDRVYIFLAPSTEGTLSVTLIAKEDPAALESLVGEFFNELIDQKIRAQLEVEAGPIREILVAQAFSEGNLLDPRRDDGDYETDPLGIGRSR